MTREFRERGLIVDEDVSHYDGTTAVVRTEHLSAGRHRVPALAGGAVDEAAAPAAAFLHSPGFVLRHGREMLAHTFAGSSWRSVLGLEDERAVFERYRQRRSMERLSLLQA